MVGHFQRVATVFIAGRRSRDRDALRAVQQQFVYRVDIERGGRLVGGNGDAGRDGDFT